MSEWIKDARAAIAAAREYCETVRVKLAERVAPAGTPDPALVEREQHAVHGYAWAAATLAAIEATTDWAARAASGGRFGETEELTLRIGLGEALGQLAYGLPMSASEVVRPAAFACEAEARVLAADPAVARFLAEGSTAAGAALDIAACEALGIQVAAQLRAAGALV